MALDPAELNRLAANLELALDGVLDARLALCPFPRQRSPPSGRRPAFFVCECATFLATLCTYEVKNIFLIEIWVIVDRG
jgi:hypothetical protein